MFYNNRELLSLYKEPYEKGREDGIEEGRQKEKMDTTIRLLTNMNNKLIKAIGMNYNTHHMNG